MTFHSTRSLGQEVSFKEAIFQGLAPDGGLYQPTQELNLRGGLSAFGPQTSFVEVAQFLARAIVGDDFGQEQLRSMVEKAFPFSPKLIQLDDEEFILELFHGPSCAFKDYGASFLATIMEAYLDKERERAIILTATSGDTGSAVAQAFFGKENIDVVILYPSGRVSPSQEKQLTTLGGNIHALEVEGSFDDCQRMVKEAFLDGELKKRFSLTSANSINLGRLLPQSFYYAYGFAQLQAYNPDEYYYVVPSGNFGNLTAGIFAWRWGMPVSGFVAATNANDVVPEYLMRGSYSPRSSVHTLANAMDVGNPSNFERLLHMFNNEWRSMRGLIHGEVALDEEIARHMQHLDRKFDYEACPHTAAGLFGAKNFREQELDKGTATVTLATAHPGKFTEVFEEAVGRQPHVPERLAQFMKREKVATLVEPKLEALSAFLNQQFS